MANPFPRSVPVNADLSGEASPSPPGGNISIPTTQVTLAKAQFTYFVRFDFGGSQQRERELIIYRWNTGVLGSGIGAYFERTLSRRVLDGPTGEIQLPSDDTDWLFTGWMKNGWNNGAIPWQHIAPTNQWFDNARQLGEVTFDDGVGGTATIHIRAQ